MCDGITARGPWPLADQSRHINELELLGSLYALQIFTHNSSDISVSLVLVNSTVVAYVIIAVAPSLVPSPLSLLK